MANETVGINETQVHEALTAFFRKANEVVTTLPQEIQRNVFGELNEGWVTVFGKNKQTEYVNELNQAFEKAARNYTSVLKTIDEAAQKVGTIDQDDPYTSLKYDVDNTKIKTDGIKSEVGGKHYIYDEKIKNAIKALDSILGSNGKIETYKEELRKTCRDSGLYSHDNKLETSVGNLIDAATKDVRNKLEGIRSRITRLLTSTTQTATEAKNNAHARLSEGHRITGQQI
ncbi:MAG: hypothetical protein VZS44_08500 [Bacilli bacterium]|nr:hypothetical protein [Bacilli bacterium]